MEQRGKLPSRSMIEEQMRKKSCRKEEEVKKKEDVIQDSRGKQEKGRLLCVSSNRGLFNICHYIHPTPPCLHQPASIAATGWRPCHPPPSSVEHLVLCTWSRQPRTPPLPGDKMEREGIRLTVRCVTRSCANEKQVEAPHSSLRPGLTTPQGRGAFVVQWKRGGRRAVEREHMS